LKGEYHPAADPYAAGKRAGKLGALMFSGTTQTGEYGEWQDLHAPFAPFCPQSLMTTDHARELFACAGADPCNFRY
jgi:hypothetical protein